MKNALHLSVLYLLFLLVMIGCADREEVVPSCVQVEVMGPDCEQGWFLLRILEQEHVSEQRRQQYIGQLQSGIVTTRNLPEEFQKAGLQVSLSLELYGEGGPRCPAVFMIYPPVEVKQVCGKSITES